MKCQQLHIDKLKIKMGLFSGEVLRAWELSTSQLVQVPLVWDLVLPFERMLVQGRKSSSLLVLRNPLYVTAWRETPSK